LKPRSGVRHAGRGQPVAAHEPEQLAVASLAATTVAGP
jgi:hypothetical protein